MNRKVTIRDIAYLSGVSISTVSRVVSGYANVNEETRRAVQDAIEKTGYEPNYTARALATKNADTIGVIIDRVPSKGLNNTFFIESIQSIATNLNKYNKDMLLVFSSTDKSDEDEKVKKLIQSNKVDGIIKLSVQKNDKTLQYLSETETPTVLVGRSNLKNIISVNNDNVEAMREGVEYLISKGLKKIAFVSGSPEYLVTLDRTTGYKVALENANLKYSEDNIFYTSFDIDSGYYIADELLKGEYEAVACTDDSIAFGISKKYTEVGKYIEILTFNNSYLANFSDIPFNSVDINAKELGRQAVELLLNNNKNIREMLVETNLIIRS
ncbi:MAG: LacI family DNA-binding transcriptional regulator [Helcococcus sp.]|nr:LacI family DNA-binding transcriptional regulator [Helcococcus sp.]